MWNNLMDNAKKVAEKAKEAAENIEGQLNESVGAENGKPGAGVGAVGMSIMSSFSRSGEGSHKGAIAIGGGISMDDDDDIFNDDGFYDDDDDKDEGNSQDAAVTTTTATTGVPQMTKSWNFESRQEEPNEETRNEGGGEEEKDSPSFQEVEEMTSDTCSQKEDELQEEGLYESEEGHDHFQEQHGTEFEDEKDVVPYQVSPVEEEEEVKTEMTNLVKEEIKEKGIQDCEESEEKKEIDLIEERNVQLEEDTRTQELAAVTESQITPETFDIGVMIINNNTSEEQNGPLGKGNMNLEQPIVTNTSEDLVSLIESNSEIEPVTSTAQSTSAVDNEVQNMREQYEESDIQVSVSALDKGKEDTNSGLPIIDKHEDPAHSASIYNEEQSEVTFSNHDDTAKEDSFDDMDVEINDVAKDIFPEDSELTASVTLTRNDSNLSIYVSKEEMRQEQDEISQLQAKNLELQFQLKQREGQLASKGEQIILMQELHEEEKQTLEGKVRETKEEAKKRITKAKERVESMQIKLTEANIRADSIDSTKGEQDEIIQALRMEGESLARKQGEMEHALRQSRREVRDLKSDLEEQTELREKADDKIKNMKHDLETKRHELKSAKQGVHRADKLDSDLMAAKEEKEKNSTIIRGLEHEVKEVKLKNTALKKEMDSLLKEKIEEGEVEILQVRKEKDHMLNDLELKLRSSVKEANMREDALRQEVEELRKRWQDSVRRCDALSVDLQQSSAPLMRQLESTERQIRARAAAWTELETKLRAELEGTIIQNEILKKEHYEAEMSSKRLQRSINEWENKYEESQEKSNENSKLLVECDARHQIVSRELESIKKEQLNFAENSKNEEVKAKREAVKKLRDTEDHYRDQLEAIETELRQEREERSSLETRLQALVTSASLDPLSTKSGGTTSTKKKNRRLGEKADQVNILQDTLLGLDDENSDYENSNEEALVDDTYQVKEKGSYAFMEQLSQALKVAKLEREALREQLQESEERRSELENDSVRNREAAATLPKLETKLEETKRELKEKCLEIQGLREDISDVRQMYRAQLDALLEEKVHDSNVNTNHVVKQQEDASKQHEALSSIDKESQIDGGNAVGMATSFAMQRF